MLSASEGDDPGVRWGPEATQVLPAHSGRAVHSWSSQGVAMKSGTQQKKENCIQRNEIVSSLFPDLMAVF